MLFTIHTHNRFSEFASCDSCRFDGKTLFNLIFFSFVFYFSCLSFIYYYYYLNFMVRCFILFFSFFVLLFTALWFWWFSCMLVSYSAAFYMNWCVNNYCSYRYLLLFCLHVIENGYTLFWFHYYYDFVNFFFPYLYCGLGLYVTINISLFFHLNENFILIYSSFLFKCPIYI